MRKEYILAALFAFICGCNQESASDVTCTGEDCGCTPECLETEKCIAGTCYDKNECVPACQPGTVCDGGECAADTSCQPECDSDTEKCIDGTCYDKDECVPECKKGEICESGECHLDPTWCEGRICKDNTTYCKDNRWTSCDPGYGCHFGVCIQGLAPECVSGQCSENNEACMGGTWVPCGEYDECQAGECVTQEYLCDPGTCSEDNVYRCTDESVYEKCPTGFTCKEGMCEEAYDETEMMLWQLCERNSDCGFGVCVFSISTSRPLSSAKYALSDVSFVPVSVLDPRIPEGTGVCSQDCTKDPGVCDDLTAQSNGLAEFSCQLVLLGDSEYPPVDENGIEYPLPFHDHLDTSWMEQSPFSAMCRPTEMEHEHYSETFCKSCVESSECSDNESCVMGMCLPHCFTVNSCPATFECVATTAENDLKVCVPNTGTCSTCRDLDGDGQGYGYCTKPGFDCNDLDPEIYYTTELPKTCVSNITDTNCNGYIDRLELIGSADHCNECEDVCRIDAGAEHFTRTCVQDNGGVLLDDQHMETYKFG